MKQLGAERVVILDWSTHKAKGYATFDHMKAHFDAAGFGVEVFTHNELTYPEQWLDAEQGKKTLIYRGFSLEEVNDDCVFLEKLFASQATIINTLEAELRTNKLWIALLCDPQYQVLFDPQEKQAIQALIPHSFQLTHENFLALWFDLEAQSQSSFRITITDRERAGPRAREYDLAINDNVTLYPETQINTRFATNLLSNLTIAGSFDYGDEIDFANNRLGDVVSFKPTITWNPNRHVTVKAGLTHKRLKADGKQVFTASLFDTRLTYQFSVRSFIRLALIYSDTDRNVDNYIDSVPSNNRSFSSQLLYSYKVNPQTLFFVGYSDNAIADDFIDDLQRNSKTIFMKFSYAWLQ